MLIVFVEYAPDIHEFYSNFALRADDKFGSLLACHIIRSSLMEGSKLLQALMLQNILELETIGIK